MSNTEENWQTLLNHSSEVVRLSQIMGLLSWDQQVNLPSGAAADRGVQAGLVSGLIQERAAAPALEPILAALESADDLNDLQTAGVRNIRRSYDRMVKLPKDLAERRARASMDGYAAWHRAREANDFSMFAPALKTAVALARETAAAVAPALHPYDALLEDFDPGSNLADLRLMFARLREGLVELIEAVRDVDPMPKITESFDEEIQMKLYNDVVKAMGYDLDHGRVDLAVHPFTVRMGVGDVRITTRLAADDLLSGLGGTLHEAGHAMYEQGMPCDPLGSGVDSAASLGMHESQSRFWENYIGRSKPFFAWFRSQLVERFPDTEVTPADLYRAANRIQPSLIRIFADEVTYNLHIIVRFELEVALVEGSLEVDDLPAAWNAKYKEVLGIDVPDDLQGVLQDVHWSSGTFGYFPSYTLGNLYAAALGKVIETAIPDLWDRVSEGDMSPVLSWLRTNVHSRGHSVDAPELVRELCGDIDLVDNLLDYLWSRHGKLHGVRR
ncbi:MAG: carboxypeptidase M32 [Rhodobacterales bacterium]|nr:carboxypeptidase M32 [Rhodobacterales bacterium]